MRTHRARVNVPSSHELVVKLPADFPQGEADILIVPSPAASAPPPAAEAVARLNAWIASLPPAAHVPLAAFDRGDLQR